MSDVHVKLCTRGSEIHTTDTNTDLFFYTVENYNKPKNKTLTINPLKSSAKT